MPGSRRSPIVPKLWMITNRNLLARQRGLGDAESRLSYWVSDGRRAVDRLSSWDRLSPARFRDALCDAADAFPLIENPEHHEKEQHVTLFVHGYNNDWKDAARRYRQICSTLYSGRSSLGLCVLFTWPSDGLKIGYYPDRLDARRSADELAHVLATLYEHLRVNQEKTMATGRPHCRAKISVIAHSMGAYLLQKAMHHVWTRKNQPLLVSLVNQLLLVAADVDNDLFNGGEQIDRTDGDGIANLTYRVTALYSGKDGVLGLSAGLKHFGKRRLGRSGLDAPGDVADNVWDIDCSQFFRSESDVHSAYFDAPQTRRLMSSVIRGVDRRVLVDQFSLARTSA